MALPVDINDACKMFISSIPNPRSSGSFSPSLSCSKTVSAITQPLSGDIVPSQRPPYLEEGSLTSIASIVHRIHLEVDSCCSVYLHFLKEAIEFAAKLILFLEKMLGGNNNNTMLPVFIDENHLQYHANASNQLQLFGNFPVGCNVDPINYFANEHNTPMLRPNKRGREAENISRQQKLQISLEHNVCHDEAERSASIPNQNLVSTGLRLSYDDDERNSSVTSASGSMTAAPPIILSLGDNIGTELDRQKEELDQYIKIQEENLAKGVREIKQRHTASLLTTIEKGISQKLHEKDLEIENINGKNRELVERIKQVATEAQNWHYRAKYNESTVNVLENNLQQAISPGADRGKEGFGDSEIDNAASYIDPINYLSIPGGPGKAAYVKHSIICRACKSKEVSILLMPCRHLCLCKDCDGLIRVCPMCQLVKTASFQVHLS